MFDTVQFSSGRCVALRSLRFVHITRSSLPTPELFTSSYTSSKASSTKRLSHTYTYPHPPHRYPTIHVGDAVTTNLGRIGRTRILLNVLLLPSTRQDTSTLSSYNRICDGGALQHMDDYSRVGTSIHVYLARGGSADDGCFIGGTT